MALKTDYKDFISPTGELSYMEKSNPDGSKTFTDVTKYEQIGDSFGAGDINRTNLQVNKNTNALGGKKIVVLTVSEYNQMPSHDPNTIYLKVEG